MAGGEDYYHLWIEALRLAFRFSIKAHRRIGHYGPRRLEPRGEATPHGMPISLDRVA